MTAPKTDNLYRILSLDGGGTWSLMQVRALQRLFGEHANGHHVLGQFDQVVANSGGSIVLLALVGDFTLHQIAELFADNDKRNLLFRPTQLASVPVINRYLPRYSTRAKLDGLIEVMHRAPCSRVFDSMSSLAESDLPSMVVCAFDFDRERETFFHTRRSSPDRRLRSQQAPEVSLIEAVHASSTAPILYFDAPADVGTPVYRYWDGAIGGYNNPVLGGILEAVRHGGRQGEGVAFDRIRVLSIGSGRAPPEIFWGGQASEQGVLSDITKIAGSITDDPPDAATLVAHTMLAGADANPRSHALVRLNPLIAKVYSPSEGWILPEGIDDRIFRRLRTMELDAKAPEDIAAIITFATAWIWSHSPTAVLNQAVRGDLYFDPLIGHRTFHEGHKALTHWLHVNPPEAD